jgi:hypothetical protein
MVTEVVREARRAGRALPRFGLLKLGTGNSLAWVVGARDVHGGELGADIEKLSRHAGSRSLRLVEVDGIISPFCGLGADARVDMQAFAGRYVADGFYTKALRCKDCAEDAACRGVHVNWVRAHSFAPLEPLAKAADPAGDP